MPEICVVGSLHLDFVIDAPHLPGTDETVIGSTLNFSCGGKGGNQAVAAAHYGAAVRFAGAVGADAHGDTLCANLTRSGIDCTAIQRIAGHPSGMSVAIVDLKGDYGAVVVSGANLAIDAARIHLPNTISHLLLQNEIPEDANIAIAEQARALGALVVLNAAPMRPKSPRFERLIDILIVNRVEATELFARSIRSAEEAARCLQDTGDRFAAVIVTLGGQGLVYKQRGETPQFVPAHDVSVTSTHGAGDAFVGALCAQLNQKQEMQRAIVYANAAAALHVSTAPSARPEITDQMVTERLTSLSLP